MQLQKVPKLCQFAIQVLVYCVKPLLQLLLRQFAHRVVRRVVIYVGEKNGLRERWLDVFS